MTISFSDLLLLGDSFYFPKKLLHDQLHDAQKGEPVNRFCSRILDQMALTGIACTVDVKGRNCSAREITPPGPSGSFSFSRR